MRYRDLIQLVLFVGLVSCEQPVRTKTEHKVDRAGNPVYKEFEYQYVLGADTNGNDIEVKHGTAKEFYPSGQVRAEINYVKGKVNGELKTYFEDGRIAEVSNWRDDSRNGLAKYYYDHGVLYQERTYKAGKLEGEEKTFYDNGRVRVRRVYKMDLLWQVTANYDSLGRTLDEMTVTNGTGILNSYYPNGAVKSRIEFRDGKPNGKATWYYESGKDQAVFFLVDGQKQGGGTVFHENGKVRSKSTYKNDFVIGIEKIFNRNGILISEATYKQNLTKKDVEQLRGGIFGVVSDVPDPFGLSKGIMSGPVKTYYDNGKIQSEQYYFEGLQDSLFREYYKNGVIKTDILFDDKYESNKRYERRYDKKGNVIKAEVFRLKIASK